MDWDYQSDIFQLRKPLPVVPDREQTTGGLSYLVVFRLRRSYKKAPPPLFQIWEQQGGGFLITGGFLKWNSPDNLILLSVGPLHQAYHSLIDVPATANIYLAILRFRFWRGEGVYLQLLRIKPTQGILQKKNIIFHVRNDYCVPQAIF